jgi:predicted RNase H-like nuclease (RuvC/YqgF family)
MEAQNTNDALINEYIKSLSKALTDKTMESVLHEAKYRQASVELEKANNYIVELRNSFEEQTEFSTKKGSDEIGGLLDTTRVLEEENAKLLEKVERLKEENKTLLAKVEEKPTEVVVDEARVKHYENTNAILSRELEQADKKIESLKLQLAQYLETQENLNGDSNQAQEIGDSKLDSDYK